MSYSDIDKLSGPFTDPAIRSIDVSSSPLADRPLARGEHTYYGDGIIEYEYQPPKGDIQRVCGVLGKDKTVSQSSWIQLRRVVILEGFGIRSRS